MDSESAEWKVKSPPLLGVVRRKNHSWVYVLDYRLLSLNLLGMFSGGIHVMFSNCFFFCRNVMNWKDANSTEIDPDTPFPVVIDMPEHNSGQMGGTMRLGKRTTIFHGDSILSIVIT